MTTYLLEVPLGEEQQSVWVEVAPSDVGEGVELVSDDAGRAVARLGRTLEASLDPVQAFVSTTIDSLRRAKHAPDGVQVRSRSSSAVRPGSSSPRARARRS